MRAIWMSAVIVVLCWSGECAQAQDSGWRTVSPRTEVSAPPAVTLGRPAPLLPEASAGEELPPPPPIPALPAFQRIVRGQSDAPFAPQPLGPPPPPPPPPGSFGIMPPPPPPPPAGLVNSCQPATSEGYLCGQGNRVARSGTGNFWVDAPAAVGGFFAPANGRALFQSDHAFDVFVSPVSNPFYFLDPRSLTEIKPLFMYQRTPSTAVSNHGDIWFAGLQGSVALTDRLSMKFNEVGFYDINIQNSNGDIIHNGNGFGELRLGPQYTIIRSTDTCTLLTAGLSFDIAEGSHDVFQHTGQLSLRPYISFGQNFASPIGGFNFLSTTGYSFATDDQRSDFFYSSLHLDYDVAGWHTLYPLMELNWFYYTENGHNLPLNFEGRDLINFGSTAVTGQSAFSLALGARYKFSENIQVGGVFEFPLNKPRELLDFRFTFDMIFRY